MFEGEREGKNEQEKKLFLKTNLGISSVINQKYEKREKLRWNFCVNINVIENYLFRHEEPRGKGKNCHR